MIRVIRAKIIKVINSSLNLQINLVSKTIARTLAKAIIIIITDSNLACIPIFLSLRTHLWTKVNWTSTIWYSNRRKESAKTRKTTAIRSKKCNSKLNSNSNNNNNSNSRNNHWMDLGWNKPDRVFTVRVVSSKTNSEQESNSKIYKIFKNWLEAIKN